MILDEDRRGETEIGTSTLEEIKKTQFWMKLSAIVVSSFMIFILIKNIQILEVLFFVNVFVVAFIGALIYAIFLLYTVSQYYGLFLKEGRTEQLEKALSSQQTFWKTASFLIILFFLSFFFLLFLLAMVLPGSSLFM